MNNTTRGSVTVWAIIIVVLAIGVFFVYKKVSSPTADKLNVSIDCSSLGTISEEQVSQVESLVNSKNNEDKKKGWALMSCYQKQQLSQPIPRSTTQAKAVAPTSSTGSQTSDCSISGTISASDLNEAKTLITSNNDQDRRKGAAIFKCYYEQKSPVSR
jgi:hypothetical protein